MSAMPQLLRCVLPQQLRSQIKAIFYGLRQPDVSGPATRADIARLDALKCTISYNRLGAYCVPLSSKHRPAARAVLNGRVWEPKTLEAMRAIYTGGDIVHAGTYFGDFLPFLSFLAKDSEVLACEPNLENYRCAGITIALNGLENVKLYHCALSDKRGSAHILVVDKAGRALGGASRLTFETDVGEPTPVTTIDALE